MDDSFMCYGIRGRNAGIKRGDELVSGECSPAMSCHSVDKSCRRNETNKFRNGSLNKLLNKVELGSIKCCSEIQHPPQLNRRNFISIHLN
ncbi:hypothetical protein CEXT_651061 [Caerostris extrusa]|uniref:Uncharacterized protein n=1 Tax=Caerostris extrusa TaxID=172846 RepID=A0AAV4T422_CAEEX|nr:hypothetical protein CEXT_651061 [Caerostris extrusa]